MSENIVGTMLKMDWLIGENDIAPENTTVIECASCGMRFAVPNDEYTNLIGVGDGNELNFICETCATQYAQECDEEDCGCDDIPMSEDPNQIIKEALGS